MTSAFTYNGLGQVVQVIETSSAGSVLANHAYLWCGMTLCVAHDNTQSGSPVSTEYFPQGAIIGGTSYYYVKDGLGSVQALATATGTVASQFSYDPYGSESTLSGTVESDIGYAGYFTPAGTSLDFALNRAYDPTDGRWLNRDPIGELGGVNLYAYVGDNPVTFDDPLGLCPTRAHCLLVALQAKGLSITLDAIGAIPLFGNVVSAASGIMRAVIVVDHAINSPTASFGFGAVGVYGSITGGPEDPTDSAVGGVSASAGIAATVTAAAVGEASVGARVLPGVGNAVSGVTAFYDSYKAILAYQKCMTGK